MHHKVIETTTERTNPDKLDYRNASRKGTALLEASDALLKLNRKASSAVNDAANAPDSHASFEQTRKADQQLVRALLACGKRVSERELGGLGQDATQHSMNVNDEIDAQAKAIFVGHRKDSHQNGDVGRALKYIEKGVKKMTKGLDSDV